MPQDRHGHSGAHEGLLAAAAAVPDPGEDDRVGVGAAHQVEEVGPVDGGQAGALVGVGAGRAQPGAGAEGAAGGGRELGGVRPALLPVAPRHPEVLKKSNPTEIDPYSIG